MKAVLKQEWKASRARILYTSAVIALVLLGAVLVNIISYQIKNDKLAAFGGLLYFLSICCFALIALYSALRGSGNIRTLLFSDTNYLMLLVPRRSFVLLGGKQIINLAEYLIYLLPATLYMLLLLPTAGLHIDFSRTLLFSDTPFANIDSGKTYAENVLQVFHYVFVEHNFELVIIGLSAVIGFFTFQSALNCAYSIYGAFIRMKKPNKFLILVILFLLYYIPIQISSADFSGLNITINFNSLQAYLVGLVKLAFFGIVYFSITSYLLEKKIEI